MKLLIHIGLALILFLVQNWIGGKSYSKGYIRFSLLDDKDEALSLNYVIKVFGPIVYLIICVAILQYYRLNHFVDGILNVVYYYLIIRIALIFLYERALIVNWLRIIFYYTSVIVISSIIYRNFISSVGNLLPDFSQIKNEIWLLIIFFFYQIGNGFEEKVPNNQLFETSIAFLPELKNRKRKYILKRLKEFKIKFEETINNISNSDSSFNIIIYSILIFENFNRPRIIRWFERIWVNIIKKNTTQGIMQVSSDKPISDNDSINSGAKALFDRYSELIRKEQFYNLYSRTIKKHCPDKKYIRQVLFIAKSIIDNSENKEAYVKIFDEIKSEFRLYDYND
jgi:hypothetical protein